MGAIVGKHRATFHDEPRGKFAVDQKTWFRNDSVADVLRPHDGDLQVDIHYGGRMMDIPAWALVLNTIAAGGFGLAGMYLVPRSQREALANDERRANAAVMRDKAEQIFGEISRLEQKMGEQFLAATRAAARGEDEGEPPLPSFDRIRSLAAVYYPALLSILDALEAPMQERMQRVANSLKLATESKPLEAQENALRLVTFQITLEQWKNVAKASRELRTKLIAEVRPYLPSPAS